MLNVSIGFFVSVLGLALPALSVLADEGASRTRAGAAAAPAIKVATLHPLLSDLAAQVGGERAEVVSLLKPGGDPHSFQPSPGDLARVRDARLILASGKGMEPYLDRLAASLGPGQEIYEVGRKVPSLRIEVGSLFVCCPAHSAGSIDPHWWHSIANVRRAIRYLADKFASIDPSGEREFRANAAAYDKRLEHLLAWAKRELAAVPRADRELATAHASFGYFCRDFGFRAVPVQGLAREDDPSPSYLAETLGVLRRENVRAVFPDQVANPKVLASMVRDAGVKQGRPLVADGAGTGDAASFEGMMRHNIGAIVEALRP